MTSVSRRRFLNYAVTAVVAGVVAGVGSYYAGLLSAPLGPGVTTTVTGPERTTVTTTTTVGPGVPVTTTVTAPPVTTTVTAPPVTTTVTQPPVTTTTTVTAVEKPPKTIKIGATYPASGSGAVIVTDVDKLYRAWADVINERGGLYVREFGRRLPVEIVSYDDKSDPGTVAKFYEKLAAEDKVDIFVGPWGSIGSLSAATVAEKYKIPIVCGTAGTGEPFVKGFKYTFGTLGTPRYHEVALFEMWNETIVKTGKAKTIAIVESTYPWCAEIREGIERDAKKIGLEIIWRKVAPQDTKDFTPLILELKPLKPDMMWVCGLAGFNVVFTKQSIEQGFDAKAWHLLQHQRPLAQAIGMKYTHGITGSMAYWFPTMTYGEVDVFKEAVKRSGVDILSVPSEAIHYVAIETIKAAIETSPTLKGDDLAATLRQLSFTSIWGPQWFDARNEYGEEWRGQMQAKASQIQGEEYVCLWPPKFAGGEYIYPKPPWPT